MGVNAGAAECLTWCRTVSPDFLSSLREAPCKAGSSVGSTCECRPRGRQEVWASCASPCETTHQLPQVPKVPEVQDVPMVKKVSQVPLGKSSRYLLYDARYGASFAEQVDLMLMVVGLSAELLARGWTLVLPPWCSVARWYSEGRLFWRDLFDLDLTGVIEYDEYQKRKGGRVAGAVVPSFTSKGLGTDSACVNEPEHKFLFSKGIMTYSGFCDLEVDTFRCVSARSRSLLDMLSGVPREWSSLLVKHLDVLQLRAPADATLRPARALEAAAQEFVSSALGDLPFLGVHLRRNEFERTHPESTPPVAAVAARINHLLKRTSLEQVFVATDARLEFREELRRLCKQALYYFDADDATLPDHQGKEEVIVLHALARAEHFVGSEHSFFSSAVRRERRRLGRSQKSGEEVFCSGLAIDSVKKRCISSFPQSRAQGT